MNFLYEFQAVSEQLFKSGICDAKIWYIFVNEHIKNALKFMIV